MFFVVNVRILIEFLRKVEFIGLCYEVFGLVYLKANVLFVYVNFFYDNF